MVPPSLLALDTVCAFSPQFPYVSSDAVEWNVGSLSCHSVVLRSPLRTCLGGWDGNLLGEQYRGRMTDREAFSLITAAEHFTH